MFTIIKYLSRRDRIIAGIALALALGSLLVVGFFLPQLGDSVPMQVSKTGEVLRWGSKYELLVAPSLSLAMIVATSVLGARQLKTVADQPAMVKLGASRYARNALVQSVVLFVVSLVIVSGAVAGLGIGF